MTGSVVAIILTFTWMMYVASIWMAIGLDKLADQE
jgi:hypothetical protein